MCKGLGILWCHHRSFFLLSVLLIGIIFGSLLKAAHIGYSQNAFFERLEALEGKSEAHSMVLRNMVKCMKVDQLAEPTCITNTILLAEVNGYKAQVGEVFRDANIPSR